MAAEDFRGFNARQWVRLTGQSFGIMDGRATGDAMGVMVAFELLSALLSAQGSWGPS